MLELEPFQRKFKAKAFAPNIRIAALSVARGNGKSTLASNILTECLTPENDLFQAGAEYVLCASSIEQARFVFRPARAELEPTGQYRFRESTRSLGITHTKTNTRLRVQSSDGKKAMGIVGTPVIVCDEPGAWETVGGELMWDAISTALGKPNSTMRVILIGTLAPARGGWWHDLIAGGSGRGIYVQSLIGDPTKWDSWQEIRRCNPLMRKFTESRRQLRDEYDQALHDTRLKARFLSYRLNLPSGDESEMLLTDDDWQLTLDREVEEPEGSPIVGIDLGSGRAWSAAVAVWPNGRVEAFAVAPGIPSLTEQEKRDRVPKGLYTALEKSGRLFIAEGLRVQPVQDMMDAIESLWGIPDKIIADRHRADELEDHAHCAVIKRQTRWFQAGADIRSLRKWAMDGPLNVEETSRKLIEASLAVSVVKSDDQGNTRLVKKSANNCARDDVCAALVLAVGELERANFTAEFIIGSASWLS